MTVIPITNAPRFTAQATDAVVKILRLPVAPQATCRLRFAPETKAEQALSPAEALTEVGLHKGLEAVELDGPGDPLASMATTLATIALLKNHYPALTIGLTTLGLGGEQHAAELAAAGLNRVTLLVETMELAAAEKLYAWIRPGKKTVPLPKAVALARGGTTENRAGHGRSRSKGCHSHHHLSGHQCSSGGDPCRNHG